MRHFCHSVYFTQWYFCFEVCWKKILFGPIYFFGLRHQEVNFQFWCLVGGRCGISRLSPPTAISSIFEQTVGTKPPPAFINRQVSWLFTPTCPASPSTHRTLHLGTCLPFLLLTPVRQADTPSCTSPRPLPRGHSEVMACRQKGGMEGHLLDGLTSHLALTDFFGSVTDGPTPPRPSLPLWLPSHACKWCFVRY